MVFKSATAAQVSVPRNESSFIRVLRPNESTRVQVEDRQTEGRLCARIKIYVFMLRDCQQKRRPRPRVNGRDTLVVVRADQIACTPPHSHRPENARTVQKEDFYSVYITQCYVGGGKNPKLCNIAARCGCKTTTTTSMMASHRHSAENKQHRKQTEFQYYCEDLISRCAALVALQPPRLSGV